MTKKHQVVLITGAARRVGRAIAKHFHQHGYNIIVHYRHSEQDANALVTQLNTQRNASAVAISADLDNPAHYESLILHSYKAWHRLDVLMNNASTFFPTPISAAQLSDWDALFHSNLKAPFFLAQSAAPFLRASHGNIINITDIHAQKPLKNYSIYSCAKAGLRMLTQSLALELAPNIRVNAVAPGSVIWAEGKNVASERQKQSLLKHTLLKRQVTPNEIAQAALFLAEHAGITGQTITVDGGRFLL